METQLELQDIDQIIYTQLVIARLGEKELMNWWNTDIAYELGGATFLNDLLGSAMAPISAAEALLIAGKNKEIEAKKDMPHVKNIFSLFNPEAELQLKLKERLRHYKHYPADVSDRIRQLMIPTTESSVEDLKGLIPDILELKFTQTSFGYQVRNPENYSLLELYGGICHKILKSSKNQYSFCYYQVV